MIATKKLLSNTSLQRRCIHKNAVGGNIIDCRDIASSIYKKVMSRIAQRKFLDKIPPPSLSIIYDSTNKESNTRTDQIVRLCQTIGVETYPRKLSASATRKELYDLLVQIKRDPKMDGCMLTLPMSERKEEFLGALSGMSLKKDIDAISVEYQDQKNLKQFPHYPIKTSATLEVLRRLDIGVQSKNILLHGDTRNLTFLKYIFMSLDKANEEEKKNKKIDATRVFETNADTTDAEVKDLALKADIIVTEVGLANSITTELVKPGVHVIDLSQNRVVDKDGKSRLVGDVHLDEVKNIVAGVTPVQGGMMDLSNAMIGVHTLAASMRKFK